MQLQSKQLHQAIKWCVALLFILVLNTKGCLAESRQQPFFYAEKVVQLQDSSALPPMTDKHPKLTAAVLTVLLGPLGVHRIYLGTSPYVPIVYAITLGGGLGILPLIDLIMIITHNDLDQYRQRKEVFMWLGERKE